MSSFGAKPPAGMEWQMGKTPAIIRFVNEVERDLAARDDVTDDEKKRLRKTAHEIKHGRASLGMRWQTVDELLVLMRKVHP